MKERWAARRPAAPLIQASMKAKTFLQKGLLNQPSLFTCLGLLVVAGAYAQMPTAPVITSQPANAFAIAGGNALFDVGADGTSPLYYQWYFDNSPLANGTNEVLLLTNVSGNQAGTYFVVVSNAYGTATSSNAMLSVLTFPPTITHQPQGTNVYVGTNILFEVVATGSPPMTYQWQKDGTPLTGASTSIYSITNAQVTDSGAYSVVVTNPYGSVTSSNAVLIVRALPPCVAPPPGLVSWWRAETNQLDGWDSNNGISGQPLDGPGKVGQAFVNPRVIVPDSPSLRVTNGLTLQAWVNPSLLSGTTPYTIISKFDSPTLQGAGNQSSFWLGATNLGHMYFLVSGSGSQTTNVSLLGPVLPVNKWSFVVATYDGAALRLYLNGTLAAQRAYSGGIFPGNQNLCIGAVPANINTTSTYWPFVGSIDEVCIYNRALTDSEVQALYDTDIIGMCLAPPAIVTQPQSQAVPLGEDVQFSIGVRGSRPLRYQWFFNSQPVLHATNSALVLERIRTNQAGAYSVAVSNSLGFALSGAANLSLLPGPTCTAAPDGLISWWPADNSLIDVFGTNNGSGVFAVSYVTGKVGSAVTAFSTAPVIQSGLITVPNSPSLNFVSEADFSIEAWVKAFSLASLPQGTLPGQSMIIVRNVRRNPISRAQVTR